MKLWRLLTLLLVVYTSMTLADVLDIKSVGDTSGSKSTITRPHRGMSKTEVVKKFGLPVKEMEPVGANPKRKHHRPISRWIYDEYMVVFDSDYVIDTVSRRQ